MISYIRFIRILLPWTLAILPWLPVWSLPVDLTETDAYVRPGFETDAAWLDPSPESLVEDWLLVPGSVNGSRSLRIPDLLPELPGRTPFTWTSHPPASFTILLPFEMTADELERPHPPGVYFAIIGVNWEVYLNGRVMRSEDFRRADGSLEKERNTRAILIPLDQRLLRVGSNTLALHVIGDPADTNTGLFRTGPYLIDRVDELQRIQADLASTVLIFLYFFVGAFHLLLFLRRPAEWHNLWFGLFSIALFVFNFMRTDPVNDWITDTYYIHRIEISALFLLAPLCGAFLNTVLKDTFGRFTLFTLGYSSLGILLILFTPMPFVEDILNAWLWISLIVTVPFYVVRIVARFIHEVRKRLIRAEADPELGSAKAPWAIASTVLNTVPGNLFLGAMVLAACAVFDILDNLYWHSGTSLLKYGFFFFVAGTTLILANRFISVQSKIEKLNDSLERRVGELGEANKEVLRSAEEYRLLVNGTSDIIFAATMDGRIRRVNRAVQKHLGIKPEKMIGMRFFDFVWYDPRKPEADKRLLRESIYRVAKEKQPVNLTVNLKSAFNDEPREFQVRLEHLKTDDKEEIVGQCQSALEDSLLKYFISERQKYEIGNYLLVGEDLTQRLVKNLERYLDPMEVAGIRISLREIIINAIEHGNLAVTYDEKTQSQLEDRYREFLRERQADPRYAGRKVRIEYLLDDEKVIYKIEDEGDGFDVEKVRAKKAAQVNEEALQHGRGIMMTEEIFDEMRYNNKGNAVLLTKYFSKKESE